MRALTLTAGIVAMLAGLCFVFPAPTRFLLNFTVALPELAPWIVLFDLAALALALKFEHRLILPAAICLCICAWPVAQALQMDSQITLPGLYLPIDTGNIVPARLPMNILHYQGRGKGPRPIVVAIYGGGWQRGSPDDDAALNSWLAARGYSVFAIDYRHAPEFRFPAPLEDVYAALRFIHQHAAEYSADPGRIVLLGHSSGGHLALLAAYRPDGVPVRGVIAFYSPVNLTRGYNEVPAADPIHIRSLLAAHIGGTPSEMPDAFRDASPITWAGQRVPPTLLLHGSKDHVVLPQFVRELFHKLAAAGNTVEMEELPWSEHAFDAVFSGLGSRIALERIGDFLNRTMN